MDVPLAVVYALSPALLAERVPVPRSTDVGLDAAASIDCDRAAAAKASNRVGAGI